MNFLHPHNFLFVLAYGYLKRPDGKPVPNWETDGAIERFLYMLENMRVAEKITVIASGGYTPKSPDAPTSQVLHSLADQFMDWLVYSGNVDKVDSHQTGSPVWGSRGEIFEDIEVAKQTAVPGCTNRITVGTSYCILHYWRIVIYVWLFKPKGWTMDILRSNHRMGWKADLKEIPKLLDAILTVFTTIFLRWKRVG